jgi:hypothetical protein
MGILASTVAEGVVRPAIGGALVYRRSSRGVVELAAIDGGQLLPLERRLLIMVNGHRTLAELCELFGSDKLKLLGVLAELEAKGLVKRVDPRITADLTGAITQLGAPLPQATSTRERRPAHHPPPARFYPPAVIGPRSEPAPTALFSLEEHPLAWTALADRAGYRLHPLVDANVPKSCWPDVVGRLSRGAPGRCVRPPHHGQRDRHRRVGPTIVDQVGDSLPFVGTRRIDRCSRLTGAGQARPSCHRPR